MARAIRWLVVMAVTVGVAFAAFVILVHVLRPGWQSREYVAIAIWTIPLGGLVLLFARLLRSRLRQRPIVRVLACVLSALVASVLWTFLAVALTGGYALAFDANPLWCWTAASLAGTATAIYWPPERAPKAVSRESAV
jgi:hypothetical protein